MEQNFKMLSPNMEETEIDRIALIDADFIKYVVTYRVSQNVGRDADGNTPTDELIDIINDVVDNVLLGVKPLERIFCWSGTTKNGFRSLLARDKEYKGTRKSIEMYSTAHLDAEFVKDYINNNNYHLEYNDLEADDLLSMLQCDETFIYSRDKDMLQIPGLHYDIKEDKFIEVEPQEAWRFLMTQTLTGDTADNILGVRGIGPAKAEKLLSHVGSNHLHEAVIEQYVNHYGIKRGLDRFVEIYSLLRLTFKRGDYFKEKYAGAYQLLERIKNKVL